MGFIRGASILMIASSLLLAGCGGRGGGTDRVVQSQDEGGFSIGSLFNRDRGAAEANANGIGVNSYLWRASLDTLAFMPLSSADPWGGVIITDWYTDPQKPDERFKATVYILDTRLRADALNVSLFKQMRGAGGQWADAEVSAQTEVDLENAILTRARQYRLSGG